MASRRLARAGVWPAHDRTDLAGVRLIKIDQTTAPEARSGWATLKTLFPYLWPHGAPQMRVRVVVALTLLAAAKASLLVVPVLYGRTVDALESVGDHPGVSIPIGLILGYGLARVMSLAFGELRDAVFARVGQGAIRALALRVFAHLHSMSLRFHLARQTGGLSRAIERGNRAVDLLLRFSLFNIIPTILEIALVFVVLWTLVDFRVAIVTLSTVVVYIAYTMYVTEWRLKFRRQMNDADSSANTKAIDSLLNYETVKYFGNEAHESRRFDSALRSYETAAIRSQQSLSLLNIGQAGIISVGLTTVMYLTGLGIHDGSMSIGDFVMANTYLMQLYQPLGFFGFVYREIKQSLIDIEKMFALLDEEREIAEAADAPKLVVGGAHVRFDDVCFGYDSRRQILNGVTFEIPSGHTVAVVGASGAGKSTISRLLFRFYDVDSGCISIDGQDIRGITSQSLRAVTGVVPQDTVLFNDTVYYNIDYGSPGATPASIENAARLAQIHDFIMASPDGYQTMVGERGLKLSGGEKQRVSIARAVLKDPPILVLDEATSALDSQTEQAIQANLRELSKGRTTLVIAHRLSTIVDANEIIVLDGGRIVERGRHQQLLQAGDRYAQLWRRQQESAHEGEASVS